MIDHFDKIIVRTKGIAHRTVRGITNHTLPCPISRLVPFSYRSHALFSRKGASSFTDCWDRWICRLLEWQAGSFHPASRARRSI